MKSERTETQDEDGYWSVTTTVEGLDGSTKVLLGYDLDLDNARARHKGFTWAWLATQLDESGLDNSAEAC